MLSDDGLGLAEGVVLDVVEGLLGRSLVVGSVVGTATELVVALNTADEDAAVDAVEGDVPEGFDGIGAVG